MKAFISTSLVLLLSFSLQAQIPINEEVREAIRLALDKDVDVRNQALELDKMELQRKSVLSMYIPKVEASALYAHFNTDVTVDLPTQTFSLPGPDAPSVDIFDGKARMDNYGNVFHGGVQAKAILFSGGQILNGAKALEEKQAGTRLMSDLRQDVLILDVLQSYDQLQVLRQAQVLLDATARRLAKETQRVEKAIQAGLAIPYDRDKIKLAQLELSAKKQDIQHKQQLLALKLAQQTGLDTAKIIQSAYTVEPIAIEGTQAKGVRKEIQALEHFKKASFYNVKKEKGSFLPSIAAFGGYSYSTLFNAEAGIPLSYIDRTAYLHLNELRLEPTWTLGVGLKWEVFGGFTRKHKVQEAKLSLQQVDNTLVDTREKISLQVQKYTLDLEHALEQVDIARQQEEVAKQNNILAQKQYQAGLIGVTERLASEDDFYKAALNRLQSMVNQRKAALEVLQASGTLGAAIDIKSF